MRGVLKISCACISVAISSEPKGGAQLHAFTVHFTSTRNILIISKLPKYVLMLNSKLRLTTQAGRPTLTFSREASIYEKVLSSRQAG